MPGPRYDLRVVLSNRCRLLRFVLKRSVNFHWDVLNELTTDANSKKPHTIANPKDRHAALTSHFYETFSKAIRSGFVTEWRSVAVSNWLALAKVPDQRTKLR
ncbi:hypothetical protein BN77_p240002 [Rhizobium mesoamericanum STM3625]|uniref:Uncharacterized protein n=1 Tax=Rhizobium mesoamericanum STM3625 TaxID=1211777 RepID=K0Q6Q6_9HYPH|nr:hypothetical protein BN77_p240002 [Rhizobium mesoamericanum STM3625]